MSASGGRRALVAMLAILAAACGDPGSSSHPARTALPTATQTAASSSPTPTHSVPPSLTPTAEPSPTATTSPTRVRTPLACANLAGAPIGGATIRSAEAVVPAGGNPEFCKVTGTVETALNFELRLPSGWTQKVLFIGGGGYDGSVPIPNDGTANADVLQRGYATIATDSGHSGSVLDAAWALDDPEAVQNFADRAWHTVLLAAREIITAYYAAPIRRTYFQGGSSGGREALIMAQRWPDDCDGVIARAPALDFVAVLLSANRLAKQVYATPGGYLPAATTEALGRAVLTACDALDGLVDGMVSDVEGCQFDAGALRCTGPPTDACLTDAQLDTVRAVHSPFPIPVALANGVAEYPRYPVGGEESSSGWPLWITGFSPDPPSSFLFILSDGFVKYFVTKDPDFDSLAFEPQDHADTLTSLSALLDATDPDLSRFAARGGKVILWHGWSDYALSAYSTVAYHERVISTAGGQSAADEFVRFYASPAVDHLNNGAGAPIFDLLGALDAWVEEGAAPGDLVAYKVLPGSDAPVPFRPLCRYPTYPRYLGSGDPNHASSFTCAAP